MKYFRETNIFIQLHIFSIFLLGKHSCLCDDDITENKNKKGLVLEWKKNTEGSLKCTKIFGSNILPL